MTQYESARLWGLVVHHGAVLETSDWALAGNEAQAVARAGGSTADSLARALGDTIRRALRARGLRPSPAPTPRADTGIRVGQLEEDAPFQYDARPIARLTPVRHIFKLDTRGTECGELVLDARPSFTVCRRESSASPPWRESKLWVRFTVAPASAPDRALEESEAAHVLRLLDALRDATLDSLAQHYVSLVRGAVSRLASVGVSQPRVTHALHVYYACAAAALGSKMDGLDDDVSDLGRDLLRGEYSPEVLRRAEVQERAARIRQLMQRLFPCPLSGPDFGPPTERWVPSLVDGVVGIARKLEGSPSPSAETRLPVVHCVTGLAPSAQTGRDGSAWRDSGSDEWVSRIFSRSVASDLGGRF